MKIKYDENGIHTISYIVDGKFHREDGPAYIEYNDNGNIYNETYFRYGLMHREDGPAKIVYAYDGTKKYEVYYKNGQVHREDGPAFVQYDNNLDYYFVDGYNVTDLVEKHPEILTDKALRKILL